MNGKKQAFELRGRHVLAMMLAFFGLVIGVNVVFAVAAVQTFPGEDVQHSYLQGLRYNQTLAERREQASLGWRVETALADGKVWVTLYDREGAPLRDARLAGELEWPADARLDRQLAFASPAPGRFAAAVDDLRPGRWRLRARASAGADALDFESELQWRR